MGRQLVGPEGSAAERLDGRPTRGQVEIGEVAGWHRGAVPCPRIRLRLAAAKCDRTGVTAGRRGRLVDRRRRRRGQGREHR